MIPAPEFAEQDVLQTAGSVYQGSEHPLEQAIVSEARRRGLALDKPETFESASGIGVRGNVRGSRIALGDTALMEAENDHWKVLQEEAEGLRSEGASVMYLAVDGRLAGLIAVSDPFKATTVEALTTLRDAGINVIMATPAMA